MIVHGFEKFVVIWRISKEFHSVMSHLWVRIVNCDWELDNQPNNAIEDDYAQKSWKWLKSPSFSWLQRSNCSCRQQNRFTSRTIRVVWRRKEIGGIMEGDILGNISETKRKCWRYFYPIAATHWEGNVRRVVRAVQEKVVDNFWKLIILQKVWQGGGGLVMPKNHDVGWLLLMSNAIALSKIIEGH